MTKRNIFKTLFCLALLVIFALNIVHAEPSWIRIDNEEAVGLNFNPNKSAKISRIIEYKGNPYIVWEEYDEDESTVHI